LQTPAPGARFMSEPSKHGRARPHSACRAGFVSVAALHCGSALLAGSSLLQGGLPQLDADAAFVACPNASVGSQQPEAHTQARAHSRDCIALSSRLGEDAERFARDGVLLTFWPSQAFGSSLVARLDAYLAPAYRRPHLRPRKPRRGEPDRVSYGDYQRLAPSDRTVQGPHQENMPGDPLRTATRLVAFACEEPAARGGATALFDMQEAWSRLPPDLQELLRGSSFEYPMLRADWQKAPCVLENEFNGLPALQFYGFGRVALECADAYRRLTGNREVELDPHTYGVNPTRDMLLVNDTDGERQPFVGDMLRRTVASIYETMVVHHWRKGEVLLVDNLRWAHARLEGDGPRRSIHFVVYGRA